MTGYNRLERTAFRLGKRLVRFADEHFAQRMATQTLAAIRERVA